MNILLFKTLGLKNKIKGCRYIMCSFIALCALFFPSSISAEDIFGQLAEDPSVNSSYISGRFSQNMQTWRSRLNSKGLNVGDGFSALYTYTCFSTESVNKAKEILASYKKKHPDLEVMMSSREYGGEYALYELFDKDNRVKLCLVWNQVSPENCEIVVINWNKGYKRGERYNDEEN